jgi:hypothetical protein
LASLLVLLMSLAILNYLSVQISWFEESLW